MYKVIIVDDEDLIREGLKTFVNWNDMGFTVAGEASNGNEAFDLIQNFKPHVVLTDIKMPCCTGIELMQKIKDSNINCKIVVLSGYDEFDYVKKALEVGAVDYLLKPIKFDKLIEVFSKIKTDYDREIKEHIKTNKAFNLLKEQFFVKLVYGIIKDKDEIFKQLEELDAKFDFEYYTAVIVEIDDYVEISNKVKKNDVDLLKFMVKNIADEICMPLGMAYTINGNDGESVVVIGVDCSKRDDIKPVISHMKVCLDKVLDFTTTISIGELCKEISGISYSYISAKEISKFKFRLGKNRVFYGKDTDCNIISSQLKSEAETIENTDNKIILMLQNYDLNGINELIDQIFLKLDDKDLIYKEFYSIINLISKFVEKNNKNLSDIIDKKALRYDSVIKKETLEDIIRELKEIFTKVLQYFKVTDFKNTSRVVEEMKDYVENHLGEDISLDILAQKVHMHPMYLSKIFKKESGMTFISYLTDIRVNKAKELMQDITLKTYEISQKVGYYSPKHFSKVFKSITGVTPTEYRKCILGYDEE